jgi:aminomethyltransferase
MPQRTPLYERHRTLGGRLVDFAGWDMPVSYQGAADEHRAVRERCGLFDVSHMGEIEVRGPGAAAWCDRMTANDVRRLGDGDCQYSILCDDAGGVIDDLVVYRLAADRYLLVVNAANTGTDLEWLLAHRASDAEVVDRSAATGLLALQGPHAVEVLGRLGAAPARAMRPFTARHEALAGERLLVSRTGYTGEDGFEIFAPADRVGAVWDRILAVTLQLGGMACGLAARDTLRLEAGLPLCGTDMDRTTTPLEAGLGWVVKLGKPDFVGRDALAAQHARGLPRHLVGLVMEESGVPRHGFAVYAGSESVGWVTSGTRSPTLERFIAMAYVPPALAVPGTQVAVDVRGRRHAARVVQRPFYRRAR